MVKICDNQYPPENEEIYREYFSLFPYELSPFQKFAIEAIVNGNHVITTAPTGSGKTLSGEFAIQHFVAKGKKVIYLSPIKALTNQKYYDFTNKYPDIQFGISTGDIKFNPMADCIVMTNEILMNRLFNHNQLKENESTTHPNLLTLDTSPMLEFQIDIENELGCVVFDEVHVINDEDRGHALEKIIMMLPKHVIMVMMSGTLDNPVYFAEWVERCKREPIMDMEVERCKREPIMDMEVERCKREPIMDMEVERCKREPIIDEMLHNKSYQNELEKEKEVYLASTNHRIVPLTHYGYLTTTEACIRIFKDKKIEQTLRNSCNKLIKLQDEKYHFSESGYKELAKVLDIFDKRDVVMKRKHVLNNLSLFLKENDMLPAIYFVYSRKNVELIAQEITVSPLEFDSKVAYVVRRECELILRRLPNYREYLQLPEYLQVVKQLEMGIGMHHSGMIPILREIVELMIEKKYVKILVATESFAIGLNCPIRTAVFTGLTKHDGKRLRFLESHEYAQGSGRAGRRGIDTVGHVVHCNNLFRLPSADEYKHIMSGKPAKLVSKFNISYNVILSLLKRGVNTRFYEFANKSMMNNNIYNKIEAQKILLKDIRAKLQRKEESVSKLRTSIEICEKVIHLENTYKNAGNKRRKEIDKELSHMYNTYSHLRDDVSVVKVLLAIRKDYKEEEKYLASLDKYIINQTQLVCDVLLDEYFIEFYAEPETPPISPEKEHESHSNCHYLYLPPAPKAPPTDRSTAKYTLTLLGKIAANINEIHPLVVSKLMYEKWNNFREFTEYQLIGLFACFLEVKVPEERAIVENRCKDGFLRDRIEEVKECLAKYDSMELSREIYTGINYDSQLRYDMIDEMMEWAQGCDTEEKCKLFLQTKIVGYKKVSVGDFAKACIKLSNISKEFFAMSEYLGFVELSHKLSKIDGCVLKYIATTQSLYV
jgi:superfamily II RNA helicase